MSSSETPIPRPTVRVLLVDPSDRVLLFRSVEEETGFGFWYPIGGGVEANESVEQAIAREVSEETGLQDLLSPTEVWWRRKTILFKGEMCDMQERWFLARSPALTIDIKGFTDDERVSVTDHHWWSVEELGAATERLVPSDLAARFARLLREGPPPRPTDIGG